MADFKTTSTLCVDAIKRESQYEFGPQSQHVNKGRKIFVQVQFAGLTPWERLCCCSLTLKL